MKKILLLMLTIVLAVSAAFAVGCGSGASFTKPSLNNPGKLISDGGFLAETDNYVYVINGIGTSTDDNSFGKPVKGSLAAIDKSTLGGNVKSEIVVPKLFVASDYTSGIKINGDYVYFGSPSTDKNSSGKIANDELAFQRAKLDGSQEKGDIFFSVSSLSVKYRLTEADGNVYVIYQDTSDSSVKAYNTADKTMSTVAKTDDKNNDVVKNAANEDVYVSMGTVTFAENGDDAVLLYIVTVYNEKYYEEKASKDDYSRSTASYNMVYAVNAKGETTKVLDGESNDVTYAITLVKNGYVFYTATPNGGTAKTYVKSVKDIFDVNSAATEVKNTSYAVSGAIINGLDDVYFYDSDAKQIVKSTLVADEKNVKEVVAASDDISSLAFVNGDYVYYYNANGELARLKANDDAAETERVSRGTVNTSWYAPELVTVNDRTYAFYLDSSTIGSSYVWYTDLNAEVVAEDTDDDGENDLFYLPYGKVAGVMLAADRANVAVEAINNIASSLDYTEDNEFKETVAEARKAYEALDDEAKKAVSETAKNKLENSERAIVLGDKYNALAGVEK